MKSIASSSTNPRLCPLAGTPWAIVLPAILLTIFLSPRCQAMSLQEQSVGPSYVPNAAASINAATIPLARVLPVAKAQTPATSPIIVIGFLGGHVKKNNTVHSEVQIAMHLRKQHPTGVHVEVFQNSHGQRAFDQTLRLLDANHDGALSRAEKRHARIIIYGHSWGASETVTMARQFERVGIPVLLTVLVDRVPKFGEGDPRIPANVVEAVNFYQLNGLLHGRSTIRAEDPSRTRILGNYRLNYKVNHVSCDQYPWYARLFMGPHIEIENDPRVWNKVEALIDAELSPEKTPLAVALINSPH